MISADDIESITDWLTQNGHPALGQQVQEAFDGKAASTTKAAAIANALYEEAENEAVPYRLGALMRNGGLAINVQEIRLRRALVGLRTVRPCVEVYRDKYDFTVGTAMLADLDALIARMEDQFDE